MDLQSRKIEFVQAFLKLTSEKTILKLERILRKETMLSETDELKAMSAEELNVRINTSMEDSKNRRVISTEALNERIKQWD